jgi:hypothetical protein
MDAFIKFPKQIRVSSRPDAQRYEIMPDHYAIQGRQPGNSAAAAAYVFNEGAVTVFKGGPSEATAAAAPGKVSPAYSLVPGGSPAVPTGLIFLRLAEGVAIDERKKEIAEAGYEVAEPLAYAPNAAWLRAVSGDIADALGRLEALEKMPDVESIEPQMLMESARR